MDAKTNSVGIGLIGAFYAFKVAAPVAGQALRNFFFKPQLVSKSRKYSPLRHSINRFFGTKEYVLVPSYCLSSNL